MFVPGKPPKHTSRPQTYTKEVSGECRRKENRILGSHEFVGLSTQSKSRLPHVTDLFIILFFCFFCCPFAAYFIACSCCCSCQLNTELLHLFLCWRIIHTLALFHSSCFEYLLFMSQVLQLFSKDGNAILNGFILRPVSYSAPSFYT